MVSEGEGCVHPARIDRCSLIQGEADYCGGIGLEATIDADGKRHLSVSSG